MRSWEWLVLATVAAGAAFGGISAIRSAGKRALAESRVNYEAEQARIQEDSSRAAQVSDSRRQGYASGFSDGFAEGITKGLAYCAESGGKK